MKTLAWILTAAAVLVGADVFVMSSETSAPTSISTEGTTDLNGEIQRTGTSGIPPQSAND